MQERTCKVVYALLAFLHACNVGVQPNVLCTRLAGLEAQQLGQAHSVLGVLNDAQLDGFAKLLPEGCVLLRLCLCLSVAFCMQGACQQRSLSAVKLVSSKACQQ